MAVQSSRVAKSQLDFLFPKVSSKNNQKELPATEIFKDNPVDIFCKMGRIPPVKNLE
jgi:hypothetical protein